MEVCGILKHLRLFLHRSASLDYNIMERRRPGSAALISADANAALHHIRMRETYTKNICSLFALLRSCFALSPFEELSVLAALAVHTDLKYTRLFGYIENEPSLQFPTAGLVDALYGSLCPGPVGRARFG